MRPLCIFLPKRSVYRRDLHENKYIFLIKDDELVEKYNEILQKNLK